MFQDNGPCIADENVKYLTVQQYLDISVLFKVLTTWEVPNKVFVLPNIPRDGLSTPTLEASPRLLSEGFAHTIGPVYPNLILFIDSLMPA